MIIIAKGKFSQPRKPRRDSEALDEFYAIPEQAVAPAPAIPHDSSMDETMILSDDYLDIMEQYAKQILAQCQKVREERAQITVSLDVITADMCHPHSHAETIKGQVVAIKPSALRPEYRTADKQLVFVTGGNGSMANHYGNACFAINLYTGKDVRWERYDVQGIVKDECLPDWAKEKAAVIREQIKNHKNKEVR